MKRFFILSLNLFFGIAFVQGQGSITTDGGSISITWDATVPGILNGTFDASDLTSSPAVGELDSDGIHIHDNKTSGSIDSDGFDDPSVVVFRGNSSGGVTTGGVYSFDLGSGNRAWGVQPSSNKWGDNGDNGHMVIAFENNSGSTFNFIKIEYELWSLNDQERGTIIEMYVTDMATGATVDYGLVRTSTVTTAPAAGSPVWTLIDDNTGINGIFINDLTIANGSTFYLRFKIFDSPSGSNFRDEIAIDNIVVTGSSTSLPISLASFTATKKSTSSLLQWQTVTEVNNDYMVIERSKDGRTFTAIGQVQGAGTSYELNNYNFVDEKPETGTNYYRLRQVDYDGKSQIHKTVSVVFDENSGAVKIYPTEVASVLNVILPKTTTIETQLIIVDVTGKEWLRTTLAVGQSQYNLDVSSLVAGQFFLQLQNAAGVEVARFVKL